MAFRLFEELEHSEAYFAYRPVYSNDIFDKIVRFCREPADSSGMDFAIDLGCGEGRSTVPLCPYFDKVIKQNCKQENVDAKHQIRRPEVGCKWNKLVNRTNFKIVKSLLIYMKIIFI